MTNTSHGYVNLNGVEKFIHDAHHPAFEGKERGDFYVFDKSNNLRGIPMDEEFSRDLSFQNLENNEIIKNPTFSVDSNVFSFYNESLDLFTVLSVHIFCFFNSLKEENFFGKIFFSTIGPSSQEKVTTKDSKVDSTKNKTNVEKGGQSSGEGKKLISGSGGDDDDPSPSKSTSDVDGNQDMILSLLELIFGEKLLTLNFLTLEQVSELLRHGQNHCETLTRNGNIRGTRSSESFVIRISRNNIYRYYHRKGNGNYYLEGSPSEFSKLEKFLNNENYNSLEGSVFTASSEGSGSEESKNKDTPVEINFTQKTDNTNTPKFTQETKADQVSVSKQKTTQKVTQNQSSKSSVASDWVAAGLITLGLGYFAPRVFQGVGKKYDVGGKNGLKIEGISRGRQNFRDAIRQYSSGEGKKQFWKGKNILPEPSSTLLNHPHGIPNLSRENKPEYLKGESEGFETEKRIYKRLHPEISLPKILANEDEGATSSSSNEGLPLQLLVSLGAGVLQAAFRNKVRVLDFLPNRKKDREERQANQKKDKEK